MLHYYMYMLCCTLYIYLSIYVVEIIKTFRGTAMNNE